MLPRLPSLRRRYRSVPFSLVTPKQLILPFLSMAKPQRVIARPMLSNWASRVFCPWAASAILFSSSSAVAGSAAALSSSSREIITLGFLLSPNLMPFLNSPDFNVTLVLNLSLSLSRYWFPVRAVVETADRVAEAPPGLPDTPVTDMERPPVLAVGVGSSIK